MVTTSMASNGTNPDDPNDQKALANAGSKDKKAGDAATSRGRTGGAIPVPRAKRGGLKGFLVEVQRELKKVSWPTKAETNRLTGVVLIVCLMLVAFLTVIGEAFGFVIDLITKGTPR